MHFNKTYKLSIVTRLFILVLFLGTTGLDAQTNTWTGATDNNWHKPCNWSLNLTPTCSHDVVIPTVTTYPVITGIAHSLSLSITSAANDALTINSSVGARLDVASSGGSCSGTADNVSCFSCGSALAITHTSGVVAPESKSVNYGTVTSSLSGASKCWITRNLGATNQASSKTDNTNASAGWYWQFNLKQGYIVGPTPAWTITSISEFSDWLAAQDPCTIELGSGWRIPTYSEWLNVDANGVSGGWDNYTETYADVLKLHAAGYLHFSTGSLNFRGSHGIYWSSSQDSSPFGWYLFLNNNYSEMGNSDKAYGMSLRCLKD